AFIRYAQAAGFTLADIRGVLAIRDSGRAPCQHVSILIGEHLAQVERRIAELTRARDALRDLQHRAAETDPADCAEAEICSIIAGAGWGTGGPRAWRHGYATEGARAPTRLALARAGPGPYR